jgi:hypothetical protein
MVRKDISHEVITDFYTFLTRTPYSPSMVLEFVIPK